MAKYLKYLVFIFPLIFFLAGINIHRVKYANDPEYIYLVNSVAICDGKSVGHIDNPGTTVMQIGAVTVAVRHLFNNPGNDTLVNHVFKNPDPFIETIRRVLLVLNTIALFIMGLVAIKKTGTVWAALLLQSSVFISANTLDHTWTKLSPEPVLFFVTCLYIVTILCFYFAPERSGFRYALIFALLAAAGLGTKATFLPLTIFPLFIIPRKKLKLIYLAAVPCFFVLLTIPAIPEYERMFFWFRDLFTHTGKYGLGEKGFIDTASFLVNIQKIIKNNIIFGISVGTGSLLLLFYAISDQKGKLEKHTKSSLNILSGLVSTSLFGIILVAKYYYADHYLIPVHLLTGIIILSVLEILRTYIPAIKFGLPLIVFLMIIFLSWHIPPKIEQADYSYKITNEEMDSTNTMLEMNYSDYTYIYYYPYSLNKFSALNFGDVYAKRQMLPYLKKLYPDVYFYDFAMDLMQYWNAEIFLEDIIKYHGIKILLVGGPLDEDLLGELKSRGMPFKTIYNGRIQAIYELDSLEYNKIGHSRNIEVLTSCNFELLTEDKQNFIGLNGELFGSGSNQTDEVARSGNYSILANKKKEILLEYIPDNLKNGEVYEITVWRKACNFSGCLAVKSIKNNIFYKEQYDYIYSDENGWDKIRVRFKITPEMENESLKVYLWSKNNKQTYFDDLTIKHIIYK